MVQPVSQTAAEVMHSPLVCLHRDQDLDEVQRLLVEHGISGAPVVDGDHLVGIVSRTDVIRAQVLAEALDGHLGDALAAAGGGQSENPPEVGVFRRRLDTLRARDVMHREVTTCGPQTPVRQVAAMMVGQHIHRIVVVDGEHPVGIVSSLDLVRLLAEE